MGEIELKSQNSTKNSPFIQQNGKKWDMPQTKPMISVVNVVASASVDQKMDLNDFTRKFPDVEFHPDVFP